MGHPSWERRIGGGNDTASRMVILDMSSKQIIWQSILKENNSFGSLGSLLSKGLEDTK